ncbi:MAG: FtsQ-type POTRA domain-containing protein [Candidatus Sericytochromatia bacterium]|nr:FtsQ-type POTRA domain-containing protein [Candidatus Sericytochromatia bacterium]
MVCWSVALYWAVSQPFWHLTEVRATSPDATITAWTKAQLQPAIGLHILQVDPQRWQQRLEANPLVKRAVVRRWLLPSRMEAAVSVRRAWFQGIWADATDGDKVGLIDREGHVLRLPGDTKTESGLVFRIAPPHGNRVAENVLAGVALLIAYNEHEALPANGFFNLTHPQNVVWYGDGVTVWLGDLAEFPDQLKVKLGGILPLLLPLAKEKGKNLQYLDLRDWQNPILKIK